MEIRKLIELFYKTNEHKDWGEYSYIKFYDDGSGKIVVDKDEYIRFDDEEDLIDQLERFLK
jgi:hypothetical protein